MVQSLIFDQTAAELKVFDFNKIAAKLNDNPEWNGTVDYIKNLIRDRIKRNKITETENGRYRFEPDSPDTQPRNISAPSIPKRPIVFNADLPASVEKNPITGLLELTANNANIIKNAVEKHDAYSYTKTVVRSIFQSTKPADPANIDKDTIILRLIIINQIDGLNLSTQTGALIRIAESIKEKKIEEDIASHTRISNEKFRSISNRRLIVTSENRKPTVNFFSLVSKYIARTAAYAYDIENGYPIYDKVLNDNLHFYIPEFNARMKSIKDEVNYEEYCTVINGFLDKLNQGRTPSEKISNMQFDQMIWFAHKKENAPRKIN